MIYEYWLAGIEGISDSKKRKLREAYGDGKAIYYIEETRLKRSHLLNEKETEILKTAKRETNLEIKWKSAEEKRIHFFPYFDNEYPKKLGYIADPPYALYVLGSGARI